MPKPLQDENGSGMHVHQSLFKGERNAFYDSTDPYHLSALGKAYVAGLLHNSPSITLITNQWLNSYKRLQPGFEAPVYISWARRNRSDLVRIPEYASADETHTRVEYRSPDPACNPYFTFAVMLAAGLDGIEQERQLPEPIEENVFEMTRKEREERGIGTLPGNLSDAIDAAANSSVIKDTLGTHVLEILLRNKQAEWDRYQKHISDFELEEFLPKL